MLLISFAENFQLQRLPFLVVLLVTDLFVLFGLYLFIFAMFTCLVKSLLDGDESYQMRRFYDYRLELMRTQPRSTVIFKCSEGQFEGMYVCLGPLKSGFLIGCRQVISLDGCFLKNLFGGQLLSAVGIDANDCIYPIAWAIVDRENFENWNWFLELLANDLEIVNSHHWCFMSDRQKVMHIPFLSC